MTIEEPCQTLQFAVGSQITQSGPSELGKEVANLSRVWEPQIASMTAMGKPTTYWGNVAKQGKIM